MLKTFMARSTLVALVCSVTLTAHAMADALKHINVPAGELVAALETLSRQAAVDLVFQPEQLKSFHTDGVSGTYSPEDAIRILLRGTPLQLRTDASSGAMVIAPPAAPKVSSTFWSRFRLAQADTHSTSKVDAQNPSPSKGEGQGEDEKEPQSQKRVEVEEVIVTGSHIRGVPETGSPLQSYDRAEIDRSGSGSVQRFLQTLTANVNSTSEIAASSHPGGTSNPTSGTGINLRGLGLESTLVLVNGRRLAPLSLGNVVDVSLVPLSAVDRVEVVSDGASAIYGSDAVAGVVNLILRRDLEGIETRARYGAVEDGGNHELQLGSSFGHNWDTGSALLSYEFMDQAPLNARDRSFSRGTPDPFTLIPDQQRHGVFLTAEQSFGSRTDVFFDGSIGTRKSLEFYNDFGIIGERHGNVQAYSAAAGTRHTVNDRLAIEVSASAGISDAEVQVFEGTDGAERVLADDRFGKSKVVSGEIQFTGSLVEMPTGLLSYATGAQYRKETYDLDDRLYTGDFENDRNVTAGFIELRVPILGSPEATAGRLTLTLADRYEDYSDFGSTNNPKVGLVWNGAEGLSFRGTYGTSFRAPALKDLDLIPQDVGPYPIFDPNNGADCNTFDRAPSDICTNVLFLFGDANSRLQPEKATTWTVGFDFVPAAIAGLRISSTYYSLRYKDRIASPFASISPLDALREEATLGPAVVQRNPGIAAVNYWVDLAGPRFQDLNCFCDLSTIGAIVDLRQQNLSIVETEGVDLDASWHTDVPIGVLELGLSATKVLKFTNRFTATSPAFDAVDRPYSPLDLRMRAHGGMTVGDWSANLFVNYADDYKNATATNTSRIGSWTTADLTLGWKIPADHGPLADLAIDVGVLNVADRDPPFVQNPSATPINFDGVNANPLGRFFFAQIRRNF